MDEAIEDNSNLEEGEEGSKRKKRKIQSKKSKKDLDWTIKTYSVADNVTPELQQDLVRKLELDDADVAFRDKGFIRKSNEAYFNGLLDIIRELFCVDVFQPPRLLSKKLMKETTKRQNKLERDFEKKTGFSYSSTISEEKKEEQRTISLIQKNTSSGREQGLFVDNQITSIINHVNIPLAAKKFTYSPESHQFWSTTNEFLKIDTQSLVKIHPFTLLVLSALLDRKLIPVRAQIPVCYPELNIASAADQLWWDPNAERFVIVELKCEQKSFFETVSAHKMSTPLELIPNTSKNRSMLQLSLTKSMLERTYPETVKSQGLLVRVHSKDPLIEIFELDKDIGDKTDNCWLKIYNTFEQTQRLRLMASSH